MRNLGFIALLILLALLAACTAGHKYVRPVAEIPAGYQEMKGWKIAQPKDETIKGAWWEMFGDPLLNMLEEQVVISNQNVAAAEARYRQAQALVRASRAGYFPTVTAGASVTRSRQSDNINSNIRPSGTVTDYSLPLDSSWELDIWGKIRRSVEAAQATAQASAADLEAARLSARAALAQNYFQLRTLDSQKKLYGETIVALSRFLKLTRNRYAMGVVSMADVLQAQTQLKTTQAQAIDIGIQRAQLAHAIAILVGKAPSDLSISETSFIPVLPVIPVGIPSELLERRPDVASAERIVAAANAQIGVAQSAFFPTVTLSASGGLESGSFSQWLSWPSRYWSVGPAISELLFDGGLRRALTDQARAAYDASVASYRQTVLSGFQEVEDNLAALRILDQEAKAQDEAVKASKQSLAVTTNQYKVGTASALDVISTQVTALNNERAAVTIAGGRIAASILLIKALGGGWNSASLLGNGK
jgi:NodT family efflux transporter outer membrane factor (OMF) lipoprotein